MSGFLKLVTDFHNEVVTPVELVGQQQVVIKSLDELFPALRHSSVVLAGIELLFAGVSCQLQMSLLLELLLHDFGLLSPDLVHCVLH